MAILFWDGLDTYDNLSDFTSAKPMVNSSFAGGFGGWSPNFNTTGGRWGGRSISQGTYSAWGKIGLSNYSELYTGRAYYPQSDGGCICFWGTVGSTTPELYLDWYQGKIRAFGNGILLGESVPVFPYNVWHWIEARAVISSTNATNNGVVEVWVNNVKVISNSACITKTSNSSTAYNGVNLHGTGSYYTDDIYVSDTTGPAPWNSRLGDIRVTTLVPVSDVPGANTGGIPTTGAGNPHWTVVDETTPNSSDYITMPGQTGNTERFYTSTLPLTPSSIYLITVTARVQKSDAGPANVTFNLIGNNSTYMANGNTSSLSTSWITFRQDFYTNPQTGQVWSPANVANLQIGITAVT